MEDFIDSIGMAAKAGRLDHIVVYGYASPDGPFPTNERLSIQRCNAIAAYISRHSDIPLDVIRTAPGGVAWDGLRALVAGNRLTPERDEVLQILDRYLPDACCNPVKSEQCRKSLLAIDGGNSYKWMLANLFPQLRFSLAVYTSGVVGSDDSGEALPAVAETVALLSDEDATANGNSVSVPDGENTYSDESDSRSTTGDAGSAAIGVGSSHEAAMQSDGLMSPAPLHLLALKTNLLYDAALLPNVELEWLVNRNWSVALEGDIAWWGKYSSEKSYRLAVISPEVKRWIRPRAPWHGLYVGAMAGAGLYDFENHGHGYRGEGAMAGLTVGYMWPVGRTLSLEAELGAGYVFTRCKEYRAFEGHHVYQRTKDLHYFGPIKLKFSIVWRLFDINKSKHRNLAP